MIQENTHKETSKLLYSITLENIYMYVRTRLVVLGNANDKYKALLSCNHSFDKDNLLFPGCEVMLS